MRFWLLSSCDPTHEQRLTSGQAAKALSAASQTIRNWIRSGRLGSVRIGNRFLVAVAEIERFRGEVSRASRGEGVWEFDGDEPAASLPRDRRRVAEWRMRSAADERLRC